MKILPGCYTLEPSPSAQSSILSLEHLVTWHYCDKYIIGMPKEIFLSLQPPLPRISLCVPLCCEVEGLWHPKTSFQRAGVALSTVSCSVLGAFYILRNHFFGRRMLVETDPTTCLFKMNLAAAFSFLPFSCLKLKQAFDRNYSFIDNKSGLSLSCSPSAGMD